MILIDFYIINEYSEININYLISKLSSNFPFIKIINKDSIRIFEYKSLI